MKSMSTDGKIRGHGGPPEKEAGPLAKGPANAEGSDTNTSAAKSNGSAAREPGKALMWVPCTRSFPQDPHSQLERRREAAKRSVPLDCGCRDVWPCRCSNPQLSERMIDAGRAAARHILDGGGIPLLEIEFLRALYRRGGADRRLAERLHALTGGEIG